MATLSTLDNSIQIEISNGISMTLGRAHTNDVVLTHGSVSSRHARLFMQDDQLFIDDQNSTNGVRVNYMEVKRGLMSAGDLLEIGNVIFRVDGDELVSGSTVQIGIEDESPEIAVAEQAVAEATSTNIAIPLSEQDEQEDFMGQTMQIDMLDPDMLELELAASQASTPSVPAANVQYSEAMVEASAHAAESSKMLPLPEEDVEPDASYEEDLAEEAESADSPEFEVVTVWKDWGGMIVSSLVMVVGFLLLFVALKTRM